MLLDLNMCSACHFCEESVKQKDNTHWLRRRNEMQRDTLLVDAAIISAKMFVC